MIRRIWRGWTQPEQADAYESLLRDTIVPGIAARRIPGHRSTEILRRRPDQGGEASEVEFATIMTFDDWEAVLTFTGGRPGESVVPDSARRLLSRFDLTSAHYEVRGDLPNPPFSASRIVHPVIRELGRPGDLGWVVMAHGELYRREFGWDPSFEALVARIVADYATRNDPGREAAWIAEIEGRRVGCIFCMAADPTTAQLRILLVDPAGRGHGLGTRLVDTCLEFARSADYQRITLWTNDVLTAARRIYQSAGFELVDQQPHHSFGHDLVGQNWARDL